MTAMRKLGGMMLGHHWDAMTDEMSFNLVVDRATKKERMRGILRMVTLAWEPIPSHPHEQALSQGAKNISMEIFWSSDGSRKERS